MGGTDILSYADIFGYGVMGTGPLSHTLSIPGQIAAHFRSGASAKRVRDLLVSQGVRTAEAERQAGHAGAMVVANRKHDVIAVLVTDPNELEMPDVSSLRRDYYCHAFGAAMPRRYGSSYSN